MNFLPTMIVLILGFVTESQAQNVVCIRRKSSNTITVNGGKSFSYKTQKGKKYTGSTSCTTNYKLGSTCAALTFACSSSNINNKDKKPGRCNKGDKMIVTTDGKTKKFCRSQKANIKSTVGIKVQFISDKKVSSTGAKCKITCTTRVTTPPPPPPPTTTTKTTTSTTSTPQTTGAEDVDCQCGLKKRITRIVGGETTDINEYPWQVGIVAKGNNQVWCGATLISDRWVLTAAHCIHGQGRLSSDLQVLLGEHDYEDNTETDSVVSDIEQIINNPNYNPMNVDYDFSLLKLSNPIAFDQHPHIRPICLPENADETYDDDTATITGWGTTASNGGVSTKLQEVQVKVLTNGECANDFWYPPSWITERMLCANVDGGGKDACQGDSGGPLVSSGWRNGVSPGQNFDLIGVVSWGSGCAEAQYPGVFARVTSQLDWIKSNTAEDWKTCPRM